MTDEELKLKRKEYNKKYSETHKEYLSKLRKEKQYAKNKRLKAINILGGKCSVCGCSNNLQIHHTKGYFINGKDEHVDKNSMFNRIMNGNFDDLILLCIKCHSNEHLNNKDIFIDENKLKELNEVSFRYKQQNKDTKKKWTKEYQSTDKYKEKHRLSQQRYMQRKREKENNNVI